MSLLQVKDLSFAFGGVKAVDGVSFSVEPGEVFTLVGPNGAGKTPLIAQIAGGLKPDAGVIKLNSQDITSLSVAARAKQGLGRSYQISQLGMDLSVRRNVMIAAQAINTGPF